MTWLENINKRFQSYFLNIHYIDLYFD
jgi:hypothetical protein